MLKAVIFDFDGIIVDTEPFHFEAFHQVMQPEGITFDWPEYKANYLGLDDRDVVKKMFAVNNLELPPKKQKDLAKDKADKFAKIVATSDISPYPGVVELIKDFSAKMPIALCSGSVPSDILPVLKRFNITDHFSALVTAADVAQSKPDPTSYKLALQRLIEKHPDNDLCQNSVVAIEDSPAGIASATGAGLKVVGVSTHFTPENLKQATTVIPSLATVDSNWFEQL